MENKELFDVFKQESDERMQIVVTDMLTMEELGKNDEKIDEILRELHGLKGAARMIGLDDIVETIHALEEMFRDIKTEKMEFNKGVIDHIFSEIDKIIDYANNLTAVPENKGKEEKKPEKESKSHLFLNVNFEKVDKLINEINDYTIFFNNLYLIKKDLENLLDSVNGEDYKKEIKQTYRKIDTILKRGTIKIKSIHEAVFALRMVPVDTIFNRFKKDVRNVASEEDKKVEFVVQSGDIEADLHILRRLSDPILHILRNAVIHGIERPEDRKIKGKNEKGIIKISAMYEGNNLVVKISNDGKPIDYEEIKSVIIERGIVDRSVIENYSNEKLSQFLFTMGFTTRKDADYTSGRGIGLDAVKKIVEDELKGSIYLSSDEKETVFTLKIPLTLSSTDAAIIEDAGNRFAFPITDELMFVKYGEKDLRQIESKVYLLKNNAIYPVLFLNDILQYDKQISHGGHALIVDSKENPFSIVFDKVEDIKNIVINKLPYPAENIPFISGVTVSEGGNPILIMDLNDIKKFAGNEGIVRKSKIKGKEEKRVIKVLLAEDSPTTRDVETSILKKAGFDVKAVGNGKLAYDLLKKEHFDVVVSDIEMPEMNGFELASLIKKNEKYSDIPIIIVTTKDDNEFIQKGIEIGVDGYFLKSKFNEEDFVKKIENVI